MATRMQQRRGTAAQWISSNSPNGPILNAGEIGWESDTNKFKIGDGVTYWADLDYFADINSTINPTFGTSIVFEGATADSYETTLQVTDPTADRTITFPDATGTVALTSDIAELSQDAIDSALVAGTGITKTYNDGANTLTLAVDTTTIQARVADVSDTEIGYLNGVTSAIQTQLDAKAPTNNASFTGTFSAPTGTITSTMIADGTIVDGDINASAAIAQSKISNLTTDLGLKAPLADPTFTGTVSAANLTLSGDLTVNGTTTNINSTNLVIEDKNIILGDTASPADNTADGGGITLKGTTDKTLNWVDATDAWTSSEHINLVSTKELKINGASVLSGSTLGSGVTGSSLTSVGTITSGTWTGTAIAVANGGTGATDAETARTNLGLAIGTNVQAYNSTLAAVAGGTYTGDDSITTLGTISAGTWNGTTIAIANGGTGQTTAMAAATALLPSQTSNSGKYLTNDGSGTLSWGTVTSYSAPTLGSTSIASGATVTTIAGLTLTAPTLTGTVTASGDINLTAAGGPGSLIDELTLLVIGAI